MLSIKIHIINKAKELITNINMNRTPIVSDRLSMLGLVALVKIELTVWASLASPIASPNKKPDARTMTVV